MSRLRLRWKGVDVGRGLGRPGPVYDDAMKVLAADDIDAVLSLVGVHCCGAQPLNVELPGSARRVDLLARTPGGIVHVEFVKDPDPVLDLRMVDYWVRIRLQEPDRRVPVAQYLLVLREITVPGRCMENGREVMGWSVVRLAELDPAVLLVCPPTAAVAALARGTPEQRAQVLVAAAASIAATDPDRARTLWGAARYLASLVLPEPRIDTALKEATMPVLIRDTPLGRRELDQARREGLQEGRQEGLQEGRREGERQAVLRLTGLMLRQRFGDDPRIDAVTERLAELPDEQRLTRLAEAATFDDLQR